MVETWIADDALRRMIADASSHYPKETGGVLFGYRSHNAQVIVGTVSAGPSARHTRVRFVPDHYWQCQQLDDAYEKSGGLHIYLGDWHTHPDGHAEMSWEDRRTLKRIAQSATADAPHPLMVIGGGSPSKWLWAVHVYCGPGLFGIGATAATGELLNFESTSHHLRTSASS